jgi:hypothetical protein
MSIITTSSFIALNGLAATVKAVFDDFPGLWFFEP